MRHKQYYSGPRPYKNSYGDSNQSGEYMYDPGRWLVKAHPYRYIRVEGRELPIADHPWYEPVIYNNQFAEQVRYIMDGVVAYDKFDLSTIAVYYVC